MTASDEETLQLHEQLHEQLQELLKTATAESLHVVATFVDIRGFSSFAERGGSFDTAHYLRSVYGAILEDRFADRNFFKPTGDGMMLIHHLPDEIEAWPALLSSIVERSTALVADFGGLTARDLRVTPPVPQDLGVGIARGHATKLVSRGVALDYTGPCLNLAARLMDKARPKGVVFREAHAEAMLGEALQRYSIDRVCIRGISEEVPIEVYCTDDVIIQSRDREPINGSRRVYGSVSHETVAVLAITEIRVLRSSKLALRDQRISRRRSTRAAPGGSTVPPLVMLATTSFAELDRGNWLITAGTQATDAECAHEDVAVLTTLRAERAGVAAVADVDGDGPLGPLRRSGRLDGRWRLVAPSPGCLAGRGGPPSSPRQASEQCRRRPDAPKEALQAAQARIVTPSLRDGDSAPTAGTSVVGLIALGPARRLGEGLVLAHPPGRPPDVQDDSAMDDAVQNGRGDDIVPVPEGLSPGTWNWHTFVEPIVAL